MFIHLINKIKDIIKIIDSTIMNHQLIILNKNMSNY